MQAWKLSYLALAALISLNLVLCQMWLTRLEKIDPTLLAMADAADTITRTKAQVKAVDLKPGDRVFENVGWRFSMAEALSVARKMHRPVFLSAMVGDLYGRC